jgi:hypothetical protein
MSLDDRLVVAASAAPAATPFRLWADLDATPPCIGIAGEIDLVTCAPFRHALADACALNLRHLALDFRAVTFLGPTGLREIARILPAIDTLEIHSASPAVRHGLGTISLDDRVVVHDCPRVPLRGSAQRGLAP